MGKKRIAIIGPCTFPIPAIRGGAIESGTTTFIDMNERKKQLDIVVFTVQDPELGNAVLKYKNASFIQVPQNYFSAPKLLCTKIINKTFRRQEIMSVYMYHINKYLMKEKFDCLIFKTSSSEVAMLDEKVESKVIYEVASDYLTKATYGIKKICRVVDKFISNEYITNRIVDLLEISRRKVCALETSIDIETTSNYKKEQIRKEIRLKHGLSVNDVILLYCGRLIEGKGPLELVKAFRHTKNCKLIIVGGENFNSNQQTDYVKNLHKEAELCKEQVIFTGYIENHVDVKKYMQASDIACVPSICNEAGSLAVLEYRVQELPTIASNKGGIYNHAGGNVVFVECDEKYVSNLANTIQELVDNPAKRKLLAQKARIGIEKHSRENGYNDIINLINKL